MDFIEKQNAFTDVLAYIERKTSVPRRYQFYGIVSFLATYLVFGYCAALLCTLIGLVYPAYESIRAIESPSKEDDTQWLMYWTVFGFFSCIDILANYVIVGYTFYYLIKCAFLIWCYLPMEHNGSDVLYAIIKKVFIDHHEKIDEALRFAGRKASEAMLVMAKKSREAAEVVAEVSKEAAPRVKEMVTDSASRAAEMGRDVVDTAKRLSTGAAETVQGLVHGNQVPIEE